MLKQRVLTAVLLIVPLVAAVIWLPPAGFAALMALVVLIGAWEWAALSGATRGMERGLYVALVAGLLFASWFAFGTRHAHWLALLGGLGWLAGLLAVIAYEQGRFQRMPARAVMWCLGAWILVPAWLSLLALHARPFNGVYWVLALFVLIWGADTAAYFSGRRWGRRRIAASVSPGKTLAGLIGALCCALVLGLAFAAPLRINGVEAIGVVLLALITVSFSVLGDLVESLFKRLAGVKDSGRWLPGHGGLLDRIDSLTAAVPIFLAGLWLLGV